MAPRIPPRIAACEEATRARTDHRRRFRMVAGAERAAAMESAMHCIGTLPCVLPLLTRSSAAASPPTELQLERSQ
jgi:hypothetical protein